MLPENLTAEEATKKAKEYQQLTLIFCIGMLFIAFDYFVKIGPLNFDLFTDIIGYVLILSIVSKFPQRNNLFKKLTKFSIMGLITYIGQELLININIGMFHYAIYGILSAIGAMAFMYLGFYMMEGMLLEAKINRCLKSMQNMRGSAIIFSIVVLANFLDYLLGDKYASILYAAMLIGTMYFLLTLYNCSKTAYLLEDRQSFTSKREEAKDNTKK